MKLKLSLSLLGGVVSYFSVTALLVLLFPANAVSEAVQIEHFVGEEILNCNSVCSSSGDIVRVDDSNVIFSVIKNKHYKNEAECKSVIDFYKAKIVNLNYFPLYSKTSDFGGVFKINKDDYYAKLKCSQNFMLAVISKLNINKGD